MKKFTVLALAGVMLAAFILPAAAMEYEFGGYWRTRYYTDRDFTGDDTKAMDRTRVDTRSQLYFTPILNENLKFVNKFEFNGEWGVNGSGHESSYTDIGADGTKSFRIKNSYVDFNVGAINAKVGVQDRVLARGLIFDDDFAGAVVSYEGTGVSIPIVWMKAFDDDTINKRDVDYIGITPSFGCETFNVNPYFMYVFSDNARGWGPTGPQNSRFLDEDGTPNPDYDVNEPTFEGFDRMRMYYAGLDVNANLGPVSLWLTGIYQGGDADSAEWNDTSYDFKAFLGAAGLSFDTGAGDIHGQFIYASGDDDDDNDLETFWVPAGQSYYWSEIMGYGIFDEQTSNNSPGDQIGNIMAANLGTTLSPMESLSITIDVWYAQLAKGILINDNGRESEEKELGWEANVLVSYELLKGLNLDFVGAYLFAGDATQAQLARRNAASDKKIYYKPENTSDPYEIGTQLSLSF